MLGLIFLHFIGKYFYKLAEEFNRNKWLFAILGIVIYYIGTFIGGIILGLLDEFVELGFNWDNNVALALVVLPFGLGATYLFYYILKRQWKIPQWSWQMKFMTLAKIRVI
ncbi:MAG: hypothetical protein ACSHXF_12950 [Aquaticitalea sp.]